MKGDDWPKLPDPPQNTTDYKGLLKKLDQAVARYHRLAVAVRFMRSWQNEYFTRRTDGALRESKRAERKVDEMLAHRAGLFDGE